MDRLVDQQADDEVALPWGVALLQALEAWARPAWGWAVLILCMLLVTLPAVALRANSWVDLDNYQGTLEATGPLAVATIWFCMGWRNWARQRNRWLALLLATVFGVLVESQMLFGWIPGPRVLIATVVTSDWFTPWMELANVWASVGTRFELWLAGVAAGGAAQDNLVFATFGCAILWVLGMVTAFLARCISQGFVTAAPTLWLLTLILLYSSGGRYLLVVALGVTLALHVYLDQGALTQHWTKLQLDYSPGLLVDRLLAVLGAGAIILTVAAIMPSLYIEPLVDRYYSAFAPINLAVENFGGRLFPELRGASRLRGGGGSGMPNEFLLRGGPDQGSEIVMQVRTDEAPTVMYPFEEAAPPPGHYMRGRTLAIYDGKGWSNPDVLQREVVAANSPWTGANNWGRKQVVQSVIMELKSATIFGAPEAVQLSNDARLELRSEGDVVSVQAPNPSYYVISRVPAVNEEMLRSLPSWTLPGSIAADGALALPSQLTLHLETPPTVTERTRELAEELVAGRDTAYDKALALEQYLRQYTYDLEVPEPPDEVEDVADYFLFEIQRGYCDYYATAFVVLARLVGLPTRFATGYTYGSWNPVDGVFVIRENDAHSWPEVYFPEVGWVPFEPTAGRAQLTRIALPQVTSGSAPLPVPSPTTTDTTASEWNWQQLVWVAVAACLLWAVIAIWQRWVRKREDPWQSMLKWGNRAGRPMGVGETVLEYGRELANFVLLRKSRSPDAERIAAREIEAISETVNQLRYAPEIDRQQAMASLELHWRRLRDYLPLLRKSR